MPVQGLKRVATTDVELPSGTIPQDQVVVVVLPSAHRDESVFPDPDVFDPGRRDPGAIPFGVGTHACIGATIAKLEGSSSSRRCSAGSRASPSPEAARAAGLAPGRPPAARRLGSPGPRGRRFVVADLDGKVAVITGGGSGIGEAVGRRLSAEGARIVVADRDAERARTVAESLDGLAVTCDVNEWADQERMVEQTLAAYGRLDIAFANAGFGADRGFKESTPEHWRAMVLTNVYGPALTIRACYDALVASKAICS